MLEENILSKPTFVETNDFVLLKNGPSVKELDKNKILQFYIYSSDYESSNNEYNIEDYFHDINGVKDGITIALKLSAIWEEQLKKQFPDYTFIITFAYFDEKTIGYRYTNIRFYRFRSDEPDLIELDNMNQYGDNPVAAIVVNPNEDFRNKHPHLFQDISSTGM